MPAATQKLGHNFRHGCLEAHAQRRMPRGGCREADAGRRIPGGASCPEEDSEADARQHLKRSRLPLPQQLARMTPQRL